MTNTRPHCYFIWQEDSYDPDTFLGCPKNADWEIESPAADMAYSCDSHLGAMLRDIPSYSLHRIKMRGENEVDAQPLAHDL